MQTCKRFYKLIQAFDRTIWRKCLRLQGSQNGVFWPSYRDHATSGDFKDACIALFRFRNAIREWEPTSAHTGSIPTTLKKLVFDSIPGLEEFYLIPGGRFLITLRMYTLQVWSLYSSPSCNKEPEPVKHAEICCMQGPDFSIAYANVVNCTKVQLLLHGTTKSVSCLSDLERF